MSGAQAGQTARMPSEVLREAEAVLRTPAHPGLTIEQWTVRWDRDVWTVGEWRQHKNRRKWMRPTWHGRLDQALQRLLDRLVADGFESVSDLEGLVALVQRVYAQLGCEIRATIADGTVK